MNKEELTYEGFVFANPDDVELAKNEIKKIEYIKTKIGYKDIETLKGVYNKALENKSFVTPVGLSFMHDLRAYIMKNDIECELPAIPLYTTFRRISLNDQEPKVRTRVTKAQKQELDIKTKIRNLKIICAILVVIILAMIMITFTGSNPNILNYKRAITNQYAAWEQDLTEREAVIREKERNLKINE